MFDSIKIALALLASAVVALAQTSVITGTVKAPDGTPWQTEIQFLSKTTPIGLGGALVPTKLTTRTATNGTFSQALYPGSYQTTIKGAPGPVGWPDSVFYIFVTTNLGTYDITDLMTNGIALPAHVLLSKGSIYVWNGTNVVGLAAGSNGQALTADSTTSTGLKWSSTAGLGTVTSVDVTGGTGINATGGPITSSGTITLSLHTNLQGWASIPTNSLGGGGVTIKAGTAISTSTNSTEVTVNADTNTLATRAWTGSGYQPLDADLTGWASIATNLVAYLSQLGTAAYSNSAAFQPAGNYQPASANLTNWSGVAVADYPTRADIGSSNFVTASITNGLAHTNWLPVVIAGSNATVVTNIVSGQAQYTVSSTATGGGGGNSFNTGQFETNAGLVQLKSGAAATNLSLRGTTYANGIEITNALKWNGSGQFEFWRLGDGNNSVLRQDWVQGGLNGSFEWYDRPYSSSNKLMALNVVSSDTNNSSLWVGVPMVIRETSATNSPATKAYVDATISGSGGSTNQPHLTVTNNITFKVSTNTAGTSTAFYIDMTKAMQELRITNLGLASVTFHTTNRAPGLTVNLRVIQTATNSLGLSFNSGFTNFVGTLPPTALATNAWGVLSLSCWGTAETDILAGYAVQPASN